MVAHDQLITRYDDIGMSKRYGVGSLFNTNLPVLKGVMGSLKVRLNSCPTICLHCTIKYIF
jgi:hypothetical protein